LYFFSEELFLIEHILSYLLVAQNILLIVHGAR